MFRLPPWGRALVVAGVLAAIAYVALNRDAMHVEGLTDFIDEHPGLMPAVFVAVHVAASLAFLPRGALALAAGALFGATWGTVWAVVGSMAGALAGFLLARFVNADMLRAERTPMIGGLLRRAETGGWRLVLVARLLPVLPHSLVNYVLGLSRIPARDFVIGSLLGMLPQTVAFVQLGEAGASAASGEHFLGSLVWGAGLLLAAAAVPRLVPRRWRR